MTEWLVWLVLALAVSAGFHYGVKHLEIAVFAVVAAGLGLVLFRGGENGIALALGLLATYILFRLGLDTARARAFGTVERSDDPLADKLRRSLSWSTLALVLGLPIAHWLIPGFHDQEIQVFGGLGMVFMVASIWKWDREWKRLKDRQ